MKRRSSRLRRKLRAALEATGSPMWHAGYRVGLAAGLALGFTEGWEGCEKAIRTGALTIVGSDSTIEAKASE